MKNEQTSSDSYAADSDSMHGNNFGAAAVDSGAADVGVPTSCAEPGVANNARF